MSSSLDNARDCEDDLLDLMQKAAGGIFALSF